MKTENIIIILVLILTFSCQKGKKKSESKTDSKIELEKENSEKKFNSDTKPISKNDSENVTFRNITDLEKYNGFEKVSAQVLGNSDKALVYIQKDSLKVLILEKIIKTSSPKPNYSILDEVNLIFKNSDQYVALTQCELIENPNERMVFSLVENEDVEFFDKILKTWFIDFVAFPFLGHL
ncbi:hypothetical protein SAMN04489761_3558 [Tenacibaculum sp. MAR_2009_124]|uniref:hypothetical protein n=1 Tax=Tenacibaculum sp. MAR_2009_124 TaxID=1250059 RepID=UPI00089A0250|nr:hypothetical protein [Tenacibaculum sp. MAR_2009_124]SEC78051.1 hypothetical protein SAMN04489761_3558 [Tenacibaculum sp. MAR_2009_124]